MMKSGDRKGCEGGEGGEGERSSTRGRGGCKWWETRGGEKGNGQGGRKSGRDLAVQVDKTVEIHCLIESVLEIAFCTFTHGSHAPKWGFGLSLYLPDQVSLPGGWTWWTVQSPAIYPWVYSIAHGVSGQAGVHVAVGLGL
jgi:hypothetical protein